MSQFRPITTAFPTKQFLQGLHHNARMPGAQAIRLSLVPDFVAWDSPLLQQKWLYYSSLARPGLLSTVGQVRKSLFYSNTQTRMGEMSQ